MNSKQDKQRLFIVSELYYPEDTSTGLQMTQIAESIADRFDVKILCGQPTYAKRGTRAPKYEVHNGVEIFRCSGTTFDKNILPFRAVNMITLGFFIFWKALFKFQKGDRVMVVTTPPTMPFVAALAALMKGSIYKLLIHDQYPEVLVAAGKISRSSKINALIEYFNRWLYKHANRIIVIGRDMKILAERKSAGLGIPVSVVPIWADADKITPEPRESNEILKELGVADKIVFLYSGNMGTTHDLESLFKAAKELQNENVHFIFAGSGARRKWLDSALENEPLPNVTLMPRQPAERLNSLLNACDVALITTVSDMFGVSVPSRAANVMATGRPILAMTDPGSELALMIDEENIGWHVRSGDLNALIATVRAILRLSHQDIAMMGNRARVAVDERYTLSDRANRYAEALK